MTIRIKESHTMPQNEVVTLPARPGAAHSIADIEKLAEAVARSRMFGIQTKEQALVLMAISQAEGRHPALAARDYNIIQGRPAKTSEAMMRDFISAGGRVEWHQLTDDAADATFSHPQGGTIRIIWDNARATKAGLAGKDMWKKFPRQMMRSRCVSEGVRTVCPSATSGFYVPEEVRDMPTSALPDAPSDTAAELDQFAATVGEAEPPPYRDILAEARGEAERGMLAYRQYYAGLSAAERAMLRPHHDENKRIAAAVDANHDNADDPFGLPPLPLAQQHPSTTAGRRSRLWDDASYLLKPDNLLSGEPDWRKWTDDVLFLVGEATAPELDKLRADNKGLLNNLRVSDASDCYREIEEAAGNRRIELAADAEADASRGSAL